MLAAGWPGSRPRCSASYWWGRCLADSPPESGSWAGSAVRPLARSPHRPRAASASAGRSASAAHLLLRLLIGLDVDPGPAPAQVPLPSRRGRRRPPPACQVLLPVRP